MSHLVAAVKSEPHPQSGQDHRSSGDFSLDAGQYTVKITGNNPDPKSIFFNIMRDVCHGHDPKIQINVGGGSVINFEDSERTMYIADPRGATTDFVVEFYD